MCKQCFAVRYSSSTQLNTLRTTTLHHANDAVSGMRLHLSAQATSSTTEVIEKIAVNGHAKSHSSPSMAMLQDGCCQRTLRVGCADFTDCTGVYVHDFGMCTKQMHDKAPQCQTQIPLNPYSKPPGACCTES